jgi:hypothetical protein
MINVVFVDGIMYHYNLPNLNQCDAVLKKAYVNLASINLEHVFTEYCIQTNALIVYHILAYHVSECALVKQRTLRHVICCRITYNNGIFIILIRDFS